MQHRNAIRQDFYRAKFLLNNKFNTVNDLLRYWAFAGPCIEKCPEIEKYNSAK
jgi:hypothetical protein